MSYAKLRGRIREVFGTDEAFSKAMGLNKATISKKLNNKTDWSREEIEKACNLLNVAVSDMHTFFFTA